MEVKMNDNMTTHEAELVRLRRIEGQIRGIQKMIEEKRYCVDILTQLTSIVGAIKGVEENILDRHLRGCVNQSFTKGNKEDKTRKINEVIDVLKKFREY
jgi:DNA-binding FrmR family transcriptional regulator